LSYNLGMCAIAITPLHGVGLAEIGLIPLRGAKVVNAGQRPVTSCTVTPKMMRELAAEFERLAIELEASNKAETVREQVSKEIDQVFKKLSRSSGSLGSV
jgi:hypothetical protein